MNEIKIPTIGSISTGTMRSQDLIPIFIKALREYWPARYQAMVCPGVGFGAIPSYVDDEGDDSEWWTSEDAGFLLQELFEALNECAPENMYFGSHPGNGSDYGFWELEKEI